MPKTTKTTKKTKLPNNNATKKKLKEIIESSDEESSDDERVNDSEVSDNEASDNEASDNEASDSDSDSDDSSSEEESSDSDSDDEILTIVKPKKTFSLNKKNGNKKQISPKAGKPKLGRPKGSKNKTPSKGKPGPKKGNTKGKTTTSKFNKLPRSRTAASTKIALECRLSRNHINPNIDSESTIMQTWKAVKDGEEGEFIVVGEFKGMDKTLILEVYFEPFTS